MAIAIYHFATTITISFTLTGKMIFQPAYSIDISPRALTYVIRAMILPDKKFRRAFRDAACA